jgi:hypothetical protein
LIERVRFWFGSRRPGTRDRVDAVVDGDGDPPRAPAGCSAAAAPRAPAGPPIGVSRCAVQASMSDDSAELATMPRPSPPARRRPRSGSGPRPPTRADGEVVDDRTQPGFIAVLTTAARLLGAPRSGPEDDQGADGDRVVGRGQDGDDAATAAKSTDMTMRRRPAASLRPPPATPREPTAG